MRTFVIAVIALACAAGCKRAPAGEAGCYQVGARFYELSRARVEAAGVAPAERDGVIGLLAPMRDSMTKACKLDRWSAAARNCFAAATDQVAFYACDQQLTPEQRALLAAAANK